MEDDGIGGTDSGKVTPLFPDRPHAAGLPASPEVVEMFESLLLRAQAGQITAVGLVAFTTTDEIISGVYGKGYYTSMLGALEDLQMTVHQNKSRDKKL